MTVTKDSQIANLKSKLEDIEKQFLQAQAQVNALAGAKQAYTILLTELEAPDTTDEN